jgi:hypothetical protein
MKFRLFAALAFLSALAAGPLPAADSVGQTIAKARAFLGTERALNAVTTVHFTGILERMAKVPAPDDKTKQIDQLVRLPVDIVFQKENRQRITVTGPKLIEVTALDGYDAWRKRTNAENPTQWQVDLLDANQVKRLRANTWENLCFFVGIEKKGGRVQAGGGVTVDGIACTKLSFIHADNIVFVRYFDQATGRLVKTETEDGSEIREEGELIVNGVRFPKKVINKVPNGPTTTIVFDKVEVNSPVAASEFAVPSFIPN